MKHPSHRRSGSALLAAAMVLALLLAPPASASSVRRQAALMGTIATITVEGRDRAASLALSESLLQALEEAEAELSTWRTDSVLSRLNRSAVGVPYPLPAAVHRELAAAARCRELTDGAFDATIAPLVASWDLRGPGRLPAAEDVQEALAASGAAAIRLLPGAAERQLAAAGIEEGGFGKGAALDRALSRLRDADSSIAAVSLDLGGQLAVERRQIVADLADPRDRQRPVVRLHIASGSLATSGNSERRRTIEGRPVGHLLDPRTGWPAADFGSVTVWAPSGLLADCLSTGLFVRGAEAALHWPERPPGVEVLVLQRDGRGLRARATAGWIGRLQPLADGLDIEIVGSTDDRLARLEPATRENRASVWGAKNDTRPEPSLDGRSSDLD